MFIKSKKNLISLSKIFDDLFYLNRSIMGDDYNKSLKIFDKFFNFKFHKFPSGKKVFDWVVPKEWSVKEAFILTPKKKKICDFHQNNLHLMNYSVNYKEKLNLKDLKKILNSDTKIPNAIPYTTSYYNKKFGFNISHNQKKRLKEGMYDVRINTNFKNGNIVLGEKTLKGRVQKDFLLSSYLCHPSMANNELSGPLVLLGLFEKIKKWKIRNYNYKFLINPETIGSLCYLYKNKNSIKKKLIAGLVLTCLGGYKKKLSYKKSKNNDSSINKFFNYFNRMEKINLREYTPLTGSDERQYCSPGFDLPVGQVSRTVYKEYKEYHTSLDNKKFMNIEKIRSSVDSLEYIINAFDKLNGKLRRVNPYGEVYLNKYDLYKDKNSNDLTKTILILLSEADGNTEIVDTLIKYNLSIEVSINAIQILQKNKIAFLIQ